MALSAEETGVEIGATQDAEGLPPHEVEPVSYTHLRAHET